MASFNLGPHPSMKAVLEKYNLKEKVPLTEFINALDKRENGYTWRDLIPDGVPFVAWYLLYDAYLEDEERNARWKAERLNEYAEAGTGEAHEGNIGQFSD